MKDILSVPDEGCSEYPSSGTLRISFIMYAQNILHQVRSEYPSSGTLKISFIRYAQNILHQVRSEYPSSGTLRITFIRYAQNILHQVMMKDILSVPDEGYSERT
jgi:hypothetical protein